MDVLVVGAGPAGLAISAALARCGLRVGCLAPEGAARWPNGYGVWLDELPIWADTADIFEAQWPRVQVNLPPAPPRSLERAYGRIDNDKLRAQLIRQSEQGSVCWLRGEAVGVSHDARGSSVVTRAGACHRAALVIDASGHRSALISRPVEHAPAYQAAYGILGTFSAPPIAPQSMVLMDYTQDFVPATERKDAPTFLYGMDMGDGRFFVEETSLAGRPALGFDTLKRRLHGRLGHLGVSVLATHQIEHCLIPMDSPLPPPQRVVGFGGAASLVHPVSGYMLAGVLRRAPEVAQGVAQALGQDWADPAEAAAAAWQTLWPRAHRRQRLLYRFGLETLLGFDDAQLARFFAAFFATPDPTWRAYLAGQLSTPGVLGAMLAVFRACPTPLRAALMRSALGSRGQLLLEALHPRV